MATRQELATRALKELRLIGEGQAASASDNADAIAAIDPMLSRLRYARVYTHNNSTTFTDEVFHPLAMLLAEDLAPSLKGRPKNERDIEMNESLLSQIQNQPLNRNELTIDDGLLQGNRGYWYDWTRA